MSTNTTILQGRYTSTGSSILIPLRSGVDWFELYNITAMVAQNDVTVVRGYWQFGMPVDSGILTTFYSGTPDSNVDVYSTTGGFTYIDTSASVAGTVNATITAISTASAPVVTNTGTNGLVAGNIVRLTNVAGGATGFNGIDWLVGSASLSSTTFQLYTAPQLSVAGTTGSYQRINFDPIFYPRHRIITSIINAGGVTTVTTSVPHGYQVGQQIRLNVTSSLYGAWVAANNLITTVTAVDAAPAFSGSISFEISDDLSALGTLTFPKAATVPFTPAQVVPVGENTAYAEAQSVNILSDATINEAEIGMLIRGGATYPGGVESDVIYWKAGVSFSIDNQ